MLSSVTGTTTYVPDALNRLASITPPTTSPISFAYDARSRRQTTTRPNGVTTTYTYDKASRLTNLVHDDSVATLSSFTYGYDKTDNRTSLSTTRTGVTVTGALNYIYDDLEQLTQATRPLPAQPDEPFTYDPVGNRLRRDGQLTDAQFDDANRLLEDESFFYTYDLNGNRIEKISKATGELTQYTYDPEDQLIQVQTFPDLVSPPSMTVTYRYDGLGRRIEKDVDGVITRYVYDGEDIVLEYDGTNTLVATYTHGNGVDEPLVMERAGQTYFYHTDGLGSITDLTDASGNVSQSYVYDAFGQIVQHAGTLTNPYTYTGREFDSETGLYYHRARVYDPERGRFLSEDPIGFEAGDTNLYRYVFNDPVNWVDPWGLANLSPSDPRYGFGQGGGYGIGGGGYGGSGRGRVFWRRSSPSSQIRQQCLPKADIYVPDRTLPRNPRSGRPIPDSQYPHTQLGKRTSKKRGETYRQGREFGEDGRHVKDIDFTDHGRRDHSNPHQHRIDPKTGKRLGNEPFN